MPKKSLTVAIKRRALLLRLERALKRDGYKIRVDRTGRQTRYLLIDATKNDLLEVDLDIEAYAKKIGAMEPWEVLSD
jgi:hypothetical protein